MPKKTDEFFRRLDQAVAVASAHEAELLAHPGVVTIGAGPARKAGRLTGEAAIVVTVRRKLTRRELEAQGVKPLPSRIGQVRLDVIEQGKPVEAPEIVAAQARAREVLDKVRDAWLRTPNVTGLGIGYKSTAGEIDLGQIALKVFVAEKLPIAELRRRKWAAVPAKIEGVVTDVEELPVLRPTGASGSRDDRKDPLVGGIAVGVNTKPFWYGTLGAIVFDRTSGAQMVLSNQHVLDAGPGTDVVQPSPIGLDDSLEIGFQLDICNPLHFFRLDTPNTTVGTVLAGAAAAVALAAALSDEIDPTRRGQEATAPPVGAKTVSETHEVKLSYPELPTPGTHFKVNTAWSYTRQTDAGDRSFSADETRVNPHALVDKLLITDKLVYRQGETIRLFGLILPEACAPKATDPQRVKALSAADLRAFARRADAASSGLLAATSEARAAQPAAVMRASTGGGRACSCERYHATALLTPSRVDRAYPIVLREPVARRRVEVLGQLLEVLRLREDKDLLTRASIIARHGCVFVGDLTVGDIPAGPWRHYLYVQTVNFATGREDPLVAARIIGGLPVSQNTRPQLDVACGPFVWEDGQFDIELI